MIHTILLQHLLSGDHTYKRTGPMIPEGGEVVYMLDEDDVNNYWSKNFHPGLWFGDIDDSFVSIE